ncbi:MAG: nuclear transport factor 2 family protein [Haloplanus sp.]
MRAEATVEDYYEALRRGEPLEPYFAERPDVVKFGVGERLVGYDAVAEGLRDQTRTTDDWTVESHDLRVTERERHAYFSDTVFMSWTDREAGEFAFETRWSGTLEPTDDGEETTWLFVGMHVSTPYVGR